MKRVVSIGPLGLFIKWFRESPTAQVVSLLGLAILWGVIFFRFSHGTGFILYLITTVAMAVVALVSPLLNLIAWPFMVVGLFLNEKLLRWRNSPKTYLPAMATVEGGGIKRGLTAPQAGALLELPIPKLLTLVICGLLRKGVLTRVKDNPLEVQVATEFQSTRERRMVVAGEKGIVLHDYEQAFVDRLQKYKGPTNQCDLNEAMGGLFKSVAQRMSGYDLSDTQQYYRAIIERALKESMEVSQSIGDDRQVAKRDETVDRNFEWILLDEHWAELFRELARRGPPYRPRWERYPGGYGHGPITLPSGGGFGGGRSSSGESASGPTSQTSLGEVAASLVGWTENTMGSFASTIEPAKMNLDIPAGKGGVWDLSSVDRLTVDVLKSMAENAASGRGGGGGGGCACACAGCACACACAGGGR
jgi:hypothetical protein